jgi:hypothetical protein
LIVRHQLFKLVRVELLALDQAHQQSFHRSAKETINQVANGKAGSGNNLTLTVPLTFMGTFAGSKNVYLWALTAGGTTSRYTKVVTWTVQ